MSDKEIIEDLRAKLEAALARISELEALLRPKKTSKNSHIPPSNDMTHKNKSLRGKSNKPPGGQVGHKGSTLEMTSTPDKIETLYPNYCNSCGSSLADSNFKLQASRQVIDIPPIVATTTEYQCFGTKCSCGHHQKASFPEGVDSNIQYGENIQSLVLYMSYYQFLPFARLKDFFEKACNVKISKGTIENIIRRTAKKAEPIYNRLQSAIAVSFFVGSDETGFKLNAKKGWFWVWQNKTITYIVAATNRSKAIIQEHFPDGLPNSILCSDRLAAQLSTITKGSQICLAHLLRDLNYLIEAEQTPWATSFKDLLKDAIALKQNLESYLENNPKVAQIEARADALLNQTELNFLEQDTDKHKQTITFFRSMVKLRHALFPFLHHQEIPSDNNASERAIRNIKVKMKISGQFKSLHQEFAVIRSVIDSAIKNGKSVYHAIKAMVEMPAEPKCRVAG